MDPVKRSVILKEIEHWRQSKLLPEHYCDFLRNLYVETESDPKTAASERGVARLPIRTVFGSVGFLALILLFFLYFTSFRPVMQTAMSVLLVALLLFIGFRNRRLHPILSFAALGSGCLLSLFLGVFILRTSETSGFAEPGWTVALVAGCGVLWIAVGMAARIGLLQLCGWFALLLGYFWLIRELHRQPEWLTLQLYAVPAGLLLYYLGRRLYNGAGSTGLILMIASALFLLMPEAFGLIFTEISGLILQPALAVKIVFIGIVIWRQWNRANRPTELLTEHESYDR